MLRHSSLSLLAGAWVAVLCGRAAAQVPEIACTNAYDDAGHGSCERLLVDFPCHLHFAPGRPYEGYCDL